MRNIQVTSTNVQHVPVNLLLGRYKVLNRKIQRKRATTEMVKEFELIRLHLAKSGQEELIVEQVELDIPHPVREQYVAIVEEKLRDYRLDVKRKQELSEKLKRQGVQIFFSGTKFGSDAAVRSSNHKYASSTERAVIDADEQLNKIREELDSLEHRMYLVERALNSLKPEQKKLIYQKYLDSQYEPKDEFLIQHFEIGRQKFYEIKGAAIVKIASSLQIL